MVVQSLGREEPDEALRDTGRSRASLRLLQRRGAQAGQRLPRPRREEGRPRGHHVAERAAVPAGDARRVEDRRDRGPGQPALHGAGADGPVQRQRRGDGRGHGGLRPQGDRDAAEPGLRGQARHRLPAALRGRGAAAGRGPVRLQRPRRHPSEHRARHRDLDGRPDPSAVHRRHDRHPQGLRADQPDGLHDGLPHRAVDDAPSARTRSSRSRRSRSTTSTASTPTSASR